MSNRLLTFSLANREAFPSGESSPLHSTLLVSLLALVLISCLAFSACGTGGLNGLTSNGAQLSAQSLNFGSLPVGISAEPQVLTIANHQTIPLAISSIAIAGVNSKDFKQTNTCGAAVAAGGKCTVSVTFKPAAKGTRAGILNIVDKAKNSPLAVMLVGSATGAAPVVSISPSSLTFGSYNVGTTAGPDAVTITNKGNAALKITKVAISGSNPSDFSQSNNCSGSINASSSCTVRISFKATTVGKRSANLQLTDNAAHSPQSVALSGTGASSGTPTATSPVAAAVFSPKSLAFANQAISLTSLAQTVTLTNSGTSSLNITGINLAGANSGDFIENNTCGSTIAPGADCSIVVLFLPTLAGTRTANVVVADNASGSPQSIPLSGGGIHNVVVSWTSSPSDGSGYNVYRGIASKAESTVAINSSPVTGTTFTDATVASGTTYFYIVTAVNSGDGAQSAASPETSVTVP